jgi:signal peptidase I
MPEPTVEVPGDEPPVDVVSEAEAAATATDYLNGRSPLRAATQSQRPDYRLRGLDFGQDGSPAIELPARRPLRSRHHRRSRRRRLLLELMVVAAVTALVATVIRTSVFQSFSVPSSVMAPTLQAGDRIVVLKSKLLSGSIARGSIVVFRRPAAVPCSVGGADVQDVVARVIALPGETIWSVGQTIYIDGKPLAESGWYFQHSGQIGTAPILRTTVPTGEYFVMGDNRSDACDSRAFGAVPASSIVGKVVAVVLHNGHLGLHFF